MAKNKYSRDYRLLEEFRSDGRIKTGYEYIGDAWTFKNDSQQVEGEKKKALWLIIAAWAAFVIALLPATGMMHKLWIALPFIFTALPLFMALELILGLQKLKVPMERRHADKLNNSYPARTLAILYLSAVSFIAEAIYLVTGGVRMAGDLIMTAGTAVVVLCAFWLFKKRGCFICVTES